MERVYLSATKHTKGIQCNNTMGGATFPLLQLVAELRRNQRVRSDVSLTGLVNKKVLAWIFGFGLIFLLVVFLREKLKIRDSFFSPFVDITKADINNLHGCFNSEKSEKRMKVAAAAEKKVEMRRTTLKPATKREKNYFFYFTTEI